MLKNLDLMSVLIGAALILFVLPLLQSLFVKFSANRAVPATARKV